MCQNNNMVVGAIYSAWCLVSKRGQMQYMCKKIASLLDSVTGHIGIGQSRIKAEECCSVRNRFKA